MRVAVGAVAVLGPGLDGWEQSQGSCAGTAPYLRCRARAAGAAVPAAGRAPADQPRRSGWRWRAAEASLRSAGSLDVPRLASVFASANGDGAVIDAILRTLASRRTRSRRPSSTTRCTTARRPTGRSAARSDGASTSLGCWDASFAAALLQAAAKASSRRAPVLLCAYDLPLPPPLAAVRATTAAIRHRHGADAAAGTLLRGRIAVRFATGHSPRASVAAEPCGPAPALPNEPGGPRAAAARGIGAPGEGRCWRSTISTTPISMSSCSPC